MNQSVIHHGELPKPEGYIRFVCLSDTHYIQMQHQIPPGDVLLHAGDFSRSGRSKSILSFSSLLRSLPHTHKIVIAGNHEYSFDGENIDRLNAAHRLNISKDVAKTKSYLTDCIYLEDSGTEVFGYKVWGSPWVNGYRDGGFTLWTEGVIDEKWSLIPPDIDILLTHTPPYGILDQNMYKEHGGCPYLRRRTDRMRLKAHIFGHIHESYGCMMGPGGEVYANVAICNVDYEAVNRPVVFDLPRK